MAGNRSIERFGSAGKYPWLREKASDTREAERHDHQTVAESNLAKRQAAERIALEWKLTERGGGVYAPPSTHSLTRPNVAHPGGAMSAPQSSALQGATQANKASATIRTQPYRMSAPISAEAALALAYRELKQILASREALGGGTSAVPLFSSPAERQMDHAIQLSREAAEHLDVRTHFSYALLRALTPMQRRELLAQLDFAQTHGPDAKRDEATAANRLLAEAVLPGGSGLPLDMAYVLAPSETQLRDFVGGRGLLAPLFTSPPPGKSALLEAELRHGLSTQPLSRFGPGVHFVFSVARAGASVPPANPQHSLFTPTPRLDLPVQLDNHGTVGFVGGIKPSTLAAIIVPNTTTLDAYGLSDLKNWSTDHGCYVPILTHTGQNLFPFEEYQALRRRWVAKGWR